MATPAIPLDVDYVSYALREPNGRIALSNQPQSTAENHIVAVAISQCRKLCDTMQALLPREIRDMVYGYLLANERKCDRTKLLESDPHSMFYVLRQPADCVADLFEKHPHILDAQYVGIETKIGMAETWYRFARFIFDSLSDMKEEFEKKIWGLQLDARQHIREALVHVYPLYSHRYRTRPKERDFLKPWKLDLLDQLRAPATVTIVLDLQNWTHVNLKDQEAKWFIEGVAGFLFPVLRKMLEGGLKVMAQVALKAPPIEIKTEDLVSLDRWCQLLMEGHKVLVAAAKARWRTRR